MNIDINRLEEIRKELDGLEEDNVLFVDENGQTRYAILPISRYDEIESLLDLFNGKNNTAVSVVGPIDAELTYEEYERIKNQIMDTVEKTLCPKAEKLN